MPVLGPKFNIKFAAGIVQNRASIRDFIGLDPKTIEWVYIVQAKRNATAKEIAALCAGKPVKGLDY